MTNESIVAVYDSAEQAARAVEALEAAGVPSSAISQHASSGISDTTTTAPVHEKGFWASLFGGEPEYEHDTAVYNRSLESGSTVVTVKAPEEHLNQVMDILERHNPIDIDERASSYGLSAAGTIATAAPAVSSNLSGRDTSLPHSYEAVRDISLPHGNEGVRDASLPYGNEAVRDTGLPHGNEEVIQLSEEQLNVGKRLVNRGTTRVRRFVVETPVEEAVSLHSERVSVERRPVEAGTKVIDPDFTDRTVEVTETEEEAVVGKTARVKEEVVINKAVADRVETVRDTVRHEDVEVTRDGHETDATVSRPTTERSGV
jgi:uncharacterized protein (TIGR02271 family)